MALFRNTELTNLMKYSQGRNQIIYCTILGFNHFSYLLPFSQNEYQLQIHVKKKHFRCTSPGIAAKRMY